MKALNAVKDTISNHAPKRGELKRKKRDKKKPKRIEIRNIIAEKRSEDSNQKRWTKNTRVKDLKLQVGDQVRIATHRFGREYAKELPKLQSVETILPKEWGGNDLTYHGSWELHLRIRTGRQLTPRVLRSPSPP